MDFSELTQLDHAHIANTYARCPLAIAEGQGAYCRDYEGKEYLDFTSGIGVNVLGFCHPAWVKAVQEQAACVAHVSNYYYAAPNALLAERLCARTGCSRVFFGNSGAEANECVIKTARKYSHDRYGEGRDEIITLVNSFHGRTIAALSASGQAQLHQSFGPFTPGFVHARANDIDDLRAKISPRTCAILIELIQGEGGVVLLERAFTDEIASICAENDILLLLDEIQTGAGHTGTFLACEQFGLHPDLVSMAKGLGGGLPLGAALFFQKCAHTLGPGDHGTTYGGNPIACAGANAVMDALDDALLEHVRTLGAYLIQELSTMPHVTRVDGLGLMLGVEFDHGILGKDVMLECIRHGILFLTAKARLRLLPPLVMTQAQAKQGLAVLRQVLTNWEETTI